MITGIGTDMMGNSNSQLQGVSAAVASQVIADYDDVKMTGASVIASIKKFYDKENFLLIVDNGGSVSSRLYFSTLKVTDYKGTTSVNTSKKAFYFKGIAEANDNVTITGLSNKITSSNNYHSYVIYNNSTQDILGIYFKKE